MLDPISNKQLHVCHIPASIIHLMYSFEVNTKICQPENSDVHRGEVCFFKTNYRLMLVKSIAECSNGSILQIYRPSLSFHLPLRSLLFLSMFEWPLYTGFTVPSYIARLNCRYKLWATATAI